jgi:hypothetical protein
VKKSARWKSRIIEKWRRVMVLDMDAPRSIPSRQAICPSGPGRTLSRGQRGVHHRGDQDDKAERTQKV